LSYCCQELNECPQYFSCLVNSVIKPCPSAFMGDLRRIYQNVVFLIVYKHIKLLGLLLLLLRLLLLQPLT